ncbi:DNA repair protein XRCC4-like isoform X2 [Oryzias latipes]|uniref:DNA repair protein XRCC4-like isoform X2 n=1 Tax=Oryzias latipes TaxID=8090 RepID=UPI000CE275E1|nr:DNA repair protein XRCC4-like isoform X2 [Oryzias latipes]
MNTAVREIHISSKPGSSYFLRVDWEGRSLASGFRVLLTDGQDAWSGEVGAATIGGEAEELEMTREKYVQDLERALTGAEPPDPYSFSLSPEPPGRSVTLTYEKMQKEISFRLGSALLEAELRPAEALRQLLLHSLQRGDSLQNQNQKLQEDNQRLKQEQQRICAELKRYAGGKEALEAELYSRFVLVLNEKKAKIRRLQESVSKLQEARNSEEQESKGSVKPTRSADQDSEEEEDEYGGSTDEEPEEAQSSPSSTLPSRSSRTDSPLDDSLRDITDVAPSRKRRFRHLRLQDPGVKRPDAESRQKERLPCRIQ